MCGIIYLINNPNMRIVYNNNQLTHYYKIGFTQQTLYTRISALDSPGMLPGFIVVHAILVNDPLRIERLLHHQFDDKRIVQNRELFAFSDEDLFGVKKEFDKYALVFITDENFLPQAPYVSIKPTPLIIKKEKQCIIEHQIDTQNQKTIHNDIFSDTDDIYESMRTKVNKHRPDIISSIKKEFIASTNGVCTRAHLVRISGAAAQLSSQEKIAEKKSGTRILDQLASVVDHTLSEMKKPNNKHGIQIKKLHLGIYELMK